jgi:very-short-patch-repair endonuclease
VVEINGPTHYTDAGWAYDQRRTAWLEADGYRVLQFQVNDVDEDLDCVIDTIHRELSALGIPARRLRPEVPAPLRPASPRTCPQVGRP